MAQDLFADIVSSAIVAVYMELFLDGVYTVLIILAIGLAVTGKRLQRGDRFMIIMNIILYCFAILTFSAFGWRIRDAILNHNDAGGNENLANSFLTVFPGQKWSEFLRDIPGDLMTVLADFILVWRVYTVWGNNWMIALPSFILDVASLILMSFWIKIDSLPDGETVHFKLDAALATAYYSMTLANTIISTCLILWRINTIGRRSQVSRHAIFIEALIQSSALYAVILIIYMPFVVQFTTTNPNIISGVSVLQSIVIPVSGIAPCLMLLRILWNRKYGNTIEDAISMDHLTSTRPRTRTGDSERDSESARKVY